uniref:Nuclear protein localization protein 4 n=1 Tax=Panagrellus redivivus TaxID=6233 RepID=A0A7E4V9W4_PANRE
MVLDGAAVKKTDDIDDYLEQQDGRINQPMDSFLCRHNSRQKCSNCLPLDPYDEEYLKKKEIKHMSFHAHLRKLTDLHGKTTRTLQPLENIDLRVKLDCSDSHRPYPHGICTKCRPPILTLNRQRFRHVDNITIENEHIVNRFLDFWRGSSFQRVGYLIGRYEAFPDVPLGLKAVVAAIYEPPQTSTASGVAFDDDPNEEVVDELCRSLGMKRVGWIFTDLWSADSSKGTVHCTRHANSYLLSASECITAAHFQLKYKNYTKHSVEGYFGSKFVTVVASGDLSENINFSGYQVSNQCAAMAEADIVVPTDYMELAWAREKPLHEKHYVTDVQFTEKDEYGAEVRKDGRPLPVEYLLVDVPAGMPKDPSESFRVNRVGFPIENRAAIGQIQSVTRVAEYLGNFSSNQFLDLATNFHFLVYLLTNDLQKFTLEELAPLFEAITKQDRVAAVNWSESSETWKHFAALVATHVNFGGNSEQAENAADTWACVHCTFENTEKRPECAVCGLPQA